MVLVILDAFLRQLWQLYFLYFFTKIKTYKDLRRQLQGIDTAFLADLTDDMKDDQPLALKQYVTDEFMVMMEQYVSERYEHLTTQEGEEA